ncbi:MAG TPA: hypothetical protein VGF82_15885 [Terracidiphilus sp.]|jgi:hypothetical protein
MASETKAAAKMMPNGPGAAAVLAAGIGCFSMGVVSLAADKVRPFAKLLIFYRPTGPLSGVSTLSILIWLGVWVVLRYFWSERNVELRRVVTVSVVLLAVGILLTFPPLADLL